jgi:hypothetical protein
VSQTTYQWPALGRILPDVLAFALGLGAAWMLGGQTALGDPFVRPYINVIRMHILIFFFALYHALQVESFLVNAVVYLMYFFPWKAFRTDASDAQTATSLGPRNADG